MSEAEFDLSQIDWMALKSALKEEFRLPNASSLPAVSAGFLVKHGFWKHEHTSFAFQSKDLKFFPIKRGAELALFYEYHGRINCNVVRFDVRLGNNNYKHYFTCPITGRPSSKLYFYRERWGSRQGHGLRAEPKSSSRAKRRSHLRRVSALTRQRPHNRELRLKRPGEFDILRSEIVEMGFIPEGSEALLALFEAEARVEEKRRTRDARLAAGFRTSLRFALGCGFEVSREELRRLVAAWNEGNFISPRVISNLRGRLEDHPCLDLNTLRKSEVFSKAESCGWRLGWDTKICGNELLTLLSHESPTEVGLMVEYRDPDEGMRYQKIEFGDRPAMNRRLFLKCPINKTLHDKLYLRHGFFAGAAAHSLYPLSQ